jgi:predicted FMN-binding regulatory protein PaiB
MKEHPAFTATTEEIVDLFASQRLARLVTIDGDGIPRIGVHVFVHEGLELEVHMANDDPQLADIRRGSPVVLEADETLSAAPSHWLDPHDATHADQFYRCASVWGRIELVNDAEAIASHLAGILERYQPEGRHVPVTHDHEFYRGAIGFLTVVRVRGTSTRSKFKLAQKTADESRSQIVRSLRERRAPLDERTADFIVTPTARKPD